jgi:hypothetical protein
MTVRVFDDMAVAVSAVGERRREEAKTKETNEQDESTGRLT